MSCSLELANTGAYDRDYNWVSQVYNILSVLDCKDMFENLDVNYWYEQREKIITNCKVKCRNEDVLKCLNSTNLIFNFDRINDSFFLEDLPARLPIRFLRLVMQLRLANPNFCKIRYKEVSMVFNDNIVCPFCNLGEPISFATLYSNART